MSDNTDIINDAIPEGAEEQEEQEQYEGTAEELTALPHGGVPPWFDRKKAMLVLCAAFSLVIIFGLIFSQGKAKKDKKDENKTPSAASSQKDFLDGELQRALREREAAERAELERQAALAGLPKEDVNDEKGLPKVEAVLLNEKPKPAEQPRSPPPPPEGEELAGGGPSPELAARFSPMVPQVEGSLFASQQNRQPAAQQPVTQQDPGQQAYADYLRAAQASQGSQSDYDAQNNQANKLSFYNSSPSSGILAGNFLQADILWIGTIIPAVLETAINTDLPGNVIARVTQNIYDSHTGKKLLIPQGTLLVAQYNSSVSYAQKRIQIVWDLLIRPDGYQLELEGMNGVDPKGMAGLKAKYNENWFEYLKAAGIITMFTFATSKISEESAKYGSSETAAAVAASNAEYVKQMGGGIVNRAMNIKPTLTVPSGEKIIVMLNKNIYFPPMSNVPVVQKYTLGR